MIRNYDNPKKRLWRGEVRNFTQKQFGNERKKPLVICLPGPELLEVEQIYDPQGITRVICLEERTEHYKRMLEKCKERAKEGKSVPEIIHDDVRNYLGSSRVPKPVDMVFLDFDKKSHGFVQDCLEIVAGSDILNPAGAIVGFAVLGMREELSQQLSLRFSCGESLTDEEMDFYRILRISRDPRIEQILNGAPLLQPLPRVEREKDLMQGRDTFFKELLVRTMFSGSGYSSMIMPVAERADVERIIHDCVESVMKQFSDSFDLSNVDVALLRKRANELVTESAILRDENVRSIVLGGMTVSCADGIEDLKIRKPDLLKYMIAATARPYLLKDHCSLYYAWSSSSPMYTDIGFFQRLQTFDRRIRLGYGQCDKCNRPHLAFTSPEKKALSKKDRGLIGRVVHELNAYPKKCVGTIAIRKEIVITEQEITDSRPVIRCKDEILKLVESDPMINAKEVFDRYNVVGMNYDSVRGTIIEKLKKMGRKYFNEAEKLDLQVLANVELGLNNREIAEELGVNQSYVESRRSSLAAGKHEKLRGYIDEMMSGIFAKWKESNTMLRQRRSDFPPYVMFSDWAVQNLENADGITALTEADVQYLGGSATELAAATSNPNHLKTILSSFSRFKLYQHQPLELFRIAEALRLMDGKEADAHLLRKVAADAEAQFKFASGNLATLYPELSFEKKAAKKIRVDPRHRNRLIACFSYLLLRDSALGKCPA